MVDSRTKGARGELVIRDALRELTKLAWERIPSSGALSEVHKLKGDLYVPGVHNHYCVEAKNYADDHLNSSILTSTSPQLFTWWEQTVRQGKQVGKKPLLIFKFNRSKIFCAFEEIPYSEKYQFIFINGKLTQFYVALLKDWIVYDKPTFV